MATPMIVGLGIAAAAMSGRYAVQYWNAFKKGAAAGITPTLRKYYEGGFQPTMTRREAALILGLRESAQLDRVKAMHRRIMVANHPDTGGSPYLAAKINEAKDILSGKKKSQGDSPF